MGDNMGFERASWTETCDLERPAPMKKNERIKRMQASGIPQTRTK